MALFGGKKGKKSKVVTEIEQIISDADDFLKKGNTEKAASEYRRAHRYLYREEKISEAPEDFSELYTRAGHGLFETGEPDRAIECFDKATQLQPDNVDAWLSRGLVHLSNKTMLNYAIMCFNEVLNRYPNSVEALENKAEALLLDNKKDDAVEVYQKLIQANPSRKDEYQSKIGVEAPLTLDTINELLRENPRDTKAWNDKADLLEKDGKVKEAVECYLRLGHLTGQNDIYEKVLKLDPGNETAMEKMGLLVPGVPTPKVEPTPEPIEVSVPEPVPTEEPVVTATPEPSPVMPEVTTESSPEITPEPESPAVPEHLPATEEEPPVETPAAIEQQTVEEPIPVDTALPQAEPEPSIQVTEPVPEVTEMPAVTPEETASQELPSSPDELADKGDEYFTNEQYDEALMCFEKITELKPDDQDALHNKGAVLYKLERFDEAITTFDKLIELEPDDVTAYLTKGASYYWSGKYDEAIESLNNVVKRDSDDGAAWYYKACAEAKRGNNKLVIPFLKRAASLDDDFKERAKDDDAFDSVRNDEEFKNIVG